MVTYEHGRAPADAPVKYTLDRIGFVNAIRFRDETLLTTAIEKHGEADAICRAFHLAALADEAATMLGGAPLTPPGTTDWLRRYRAAKGER